MSEQMRTGMSNDVDTFLVFRSDDGNLCVVVNQFTGIMLNAVDLTGNTVTCQSGTNAFGYIKDGNGAIKFFNVAVGKSNFRHK